MQKTPDQIFDEFEARQAEALARKRNESRSIMRQKVHHWWPMVCCATISFICVAISSINPNPGSNLSVVAFVCFLPMCFYCVATVTDNLQQEIRELKLQVAKLQAKAVDSHD